MQTTPTLRGPFSQCSIRRPLLRSELVHNQKYDQGRGPYGRTAFRFFAAADRAPTSTGGIGTARPRSASVVLVLGLVLICLRAIVLGLVRSWGVDRHFRAPRNRTRTTTQHTTHAQQSNTTSCLMRHKRITHYIISGGLRRHHHHSCSRIRLHLVWACSITCSVCVCVYMTSYLRLPFFVYLTPVYL